MACNGFYMNQDMHSGPGNDPSWQPAFSSPPCTFAAHTPSNGSFVDPRQTSVPPAPAQQPRSLERTRQSAAYSQHGINHTTVDHRGSQHARVSNEQLQASMPAGARLLSLYDVQSPVSPNSDLPPGDVSDASTYGGDVQVLPFRFPLRIRELITPSPLP
jgi:hypothetical protein